MQIITLAHEELTLFVFFFISNGTIIYSTVTVLLENIPSIEINVKFTNISFEILIKILPLTSNYLLEILQNFNSNTR